MMTGTTKLVGIIGDPVDGSLSPVMQNAAFESLGMDWAYFAFRIPAGMEAAAMEAVRTIDMAGLNVTMPLKPKVIPYLDFVDPLALLIQSVNTIVNNNGSLEGYSTDGEGFVRSLGDSGFTLKDKRVLMIGAGGAARSVTAAIAKAGAADISVICRDVAAGTGIANIIQTVSPLITSTRFGFDEFTNENLAAADLIVNATPLGKHNLEGLTHLVDGLQSRTAIADLSTVPRLSALLVAAQERGCAVIGGRGMLVHQGSLSFKLWTGKDAPLEIMKKAVGLPTIEAGEMP